MVKTPIGITDEVHVHRSQSMDMSVEDEKWCRLMFKSPTLVVPNLEESPKFKHLGFNSWWRQHQNEYEVAINPRVNPKSGPKKPMSQSSSSNFVISGFHPGFSNKNNQKPRLKCQAATERSDSSPVPSGRFRCSGPLPPLPPPCLWKASNFCWSRRGCVLMRRNGKKLNFWIFGVEILCLIFFVDSKFYQEAT